MREITSHIVNPVNDKIRIFVVDEPGAGGANHLYVIDGPNWPDNPSMNIETPDGQPIVFQNGPINEVGVNGLTHEALLAIIADRLVSFQLGPLACDENQQALDGVNDAINALASRTKARMARGVEGKTIA